MDLRLYPAPLRGAVTPPPSKSLLHRQLICLAQAGQFPCPPDPADDVLATVRGLWALYHRPEPVIDCGASGSTLRFLLPLAMARGQVGPRFTGTRRLLGRGRAGGWGGGRGLLLHRMRVGSKSDVKRLRKGGRRIVVWDVNSAGDAAAMRAYGGDFIVTDDPESIGGR